MANLVIAQQLIEDGNRAAAIEVLNAALREKPTDYAAMNMLWDLLRTSDNAPIDPPPEPAHDTYYLPADPGSTYAPPLYWPNGGNYGVRLSPFRPLPGLASLELRMKGYGMIEPYDQAELDAARDILATRANEVREAKRRRAIERRNQIIRRTLISVAVAGFIPSTIGMDVVLGWEFGATFGGTLIAAVFGMLCVLAYLWITSD